MPSPLTAWDGALRRLAAEMPPLALKAWILPLGIRAEDVLAGSYETLLGE